MSEQSKPQYPRHPYGGMKLSYSAVIHDNVLGFTGTIDEMCHISHYSVSEINDARNGFVPERYEVITEIWETSETTAK